MRSKTIGVTLLSMIVLLVAACGSEATPVWQTPEDEEHAADVTEVAEEPTATATTVPPTATHTPEPPTATPEPPTATHTPEPPTATPTSEPADEQAGGGDPENGRVIFNQVQAAAGYACVQCHLPDSTETLIGPGLLDIPERAAERVEGQSAREYIRNSILHPSDYVVEGFTDGLMPQNFESIFSEQQLDDLVAYLMTLSDEEAAAETEAEATAEPATVEAEATEEVTGTAELPGDPAIGETLFNEFQAQAGYSCAQCHLVDSETQLIGPGLLGIPERAAERVDGQSAMEYIRNSILHPSDYVVGTFPDNLMPQNFGDIFTEEEVDHLVSYLMTLSTNETGATSTTTEATEATDATEADEAAATGDPEHGEQLFNEFQAQAGYSCAQCHLVDSETQLIGPGLLGIPSRAAERVEGLSAREYIRESILDPSAYVVETFPDQLMPQNFGDIFSEEDINDLIAYLMTLEQ